MSKKIILVLILVILIAFLFLLLSNNSVDVYIDGENISVETHTIRTPDVKNLNYDICRLASHAMNDTQSNATTLKNDIKELCRSYGLEDVNVNIDSILGPDQIPVIVDVEGTSMLPTLKDGQTVLLNKTHDVHVGDIVVADSSKYGGIIKRVDAIDENNVHLASDNKKISYEYRNGALYELKGVSTWVDISDINGVVIGY